MKKLLPAVLLLLGPYWSLFAQDSWKDVYKESEWGERDKWQKPFELIRKLNIKPGARVGDIGCHEGYMTTKLARSVGPDGKVFAVDIEQRKLDRLKANLEKRKLENVVLIKGQPDDPLLPAGQLDAVIILDTYHEIKSHDKVLEKIKEALKPGGRIVICEAIADSRRKATRETQEGKHEIALTFVEEDLVRMGFTILEKTDPFVDRSSIKGDKMWVVVGMK